jgi:valyl-tRNA synthetase
MEKRYFHSEPDERESYTVVIPPPNVTGVLHMGHMLNNTIQDVLVRRARMLGKKMHAGFLELITHQLQQKQRLFRNYVRRELKNQIFLEMSFYHTLLNGRISTEELF